LHVKLQILQGNRDMNTPIDPQAQETPPQINEQRRRLAKVGLARHEPYPIDQRL
jgi:hypothetical protein